MLLLEGERLHNFTLAVGNNFDPSDQANFNPERFTTCAHEPGQVSEGETREMVCDRPVFGRYITVYIYQTGAATHALTICELQVFGEPGKSDFIRLHP